MRAIVLSLAVLASCASPAPAPAPATEPSPYDSPITLELKKASLEEAFSLIAKHSKLNVILDRNDGKSGTVTLSFKEVPAGEALEAVAKLFGLKAVRIEKYNIVRITS